MQKVEFFDLPPFEYADLHFGTYPPSVSLPLHTCIRKVIHYEKRKIKYTIVFYLYLK